MAGSLNHLVDDDGRFSMSTIENMGDAHEALEQCFHVIRVLTHGDRAAINGVCRQLNYPEIDLDLQPDVERAGPPVVWPTCKPVLGVLPQRRYEELARVGRLTALHDAIIRYVNQGDTPPPEWVAEYAEKARPTP